MLVIVPTATDAPCYHLPYATAGMILLNCIMLGLQFLFPNAAEFFILHHGVFNPLTWISSCCMHSGISHLVGNMVGLAICGWIIEGKVGWWKFILIYFAIGISASAFEHILMFWISNGSSLGASGVIFGMFAIILIWAPENKITLSYFGLLLFIPVAGSFSVSVMGICFYLIAFEFLTVWFTFFALSSAMLHMMGAVPGAFIGYMMVKKRWVDCEGYDLMSIQSGNTGKRVITTSEQRKRKVARKRARAVAKDEEQNGLERVADYIRNGHLEVAWKRFKMLRRQNTSLIMPEDQYVAIINGLTSDSSKVQVAREAMGSYLKHHNTLRIPIVLKLARLALTVDGRPRLCIKILQRIEGEVLQPKQLMLAKALISKAKKQIATGAIDLRYSSQNEAT